MVWYWSWLPDLIFLISDLSVTDLHNPGLMCFYTPEWPRYQFPPLLISEFYAVLSRVHNTVKERECQLSNKHNATQHFCLKEKIAMHAHLIFKLKPTLIQPYLVL